MCDETYSPVHRRCAAGCVARGPRAGIIGERWMSDLATAQRPPPRMARKRVKGGAVVEACSAFLSTIKS
eukprot:6184537-Pleurochrysis_carterae.AAC.2